MTQQQKVRRPATLGDAVRERRMSLGLSLRSLAEKISDLGTPMDATALTRIENGQREPRFSEGTVLCRYLGIDGGAYVGAGATVSGAETVVIEGYRAAAQSISELLAGSVEAITSLHGLGEVSTDYEKRFPTLDAATDYLVDSIHANAVTKNVIHSESGPLHTREWMDNYPSRAIGGAMEILEDLLTLLLDDGTLSKPFQVRVVLEEDPSLRLGDAPSPGTVIRVPETSATRGTDT